MVEDQMCFDFFCKFFPILNELEFFTFLLDSTTLDGPENVVRCENVQIILEN